MKLYKIVYQIFTHMLQIEPTLYQPYTMSSSTIIEASSIYKALQFFEEKHPDACDITLIEMIGVLER